MFQKLQRQEKTAIIVQFSKFFCNEWLLPIGSISESQYHCCKRSYAIAMAYFPKQYSAFLQEYETKCEGSHMFLNRMKYIKQDYDEHLRNQ